MSCDDRVQFLCPGPVSSLSSSQFYIPHLVNNGSSSDKLTSCLYVVLLYIEVPFSAFAFDFCARACASSCQDMERCFIFDGCRNKSVLFLAPRMAFQLF